MFECIILYFRNLFTFFIIKRFFKELGDFKIMRILLTQLK